MKPRLIYCDGKNEKQARIAIDSGFEYGVRYPCSNLLDEHLTFIDVDWKNPDKDSYIRGIRDLKPEMASVLDIISHELLEESLSWAYNISDSVDKIIIIPKVSVFHKIPKSINNKEVILGYSVPSSYGKTDIPLVEYLDFRIHLLGGSPHAQMRSYLKYPDRIYSIDGNYMSKMANALGRYWVPGDNEEPTNRYWRRDLKVSRLELFHKSCDNIRSAWDNILTDNFWLLDKRSKDYRERV